MKKLFTITFLIFLSGITIPFLAIAQKEIPTKDQLYLKDGSVLSGSIRYNPKKSAETVILISEGVEKSYSVNEADGFLFEFQEKYVIKDLNTKDFDSKRFFSRLIINGDLKLYQLFGRFYIEDQSGKIIPLQKSEIGEFTKKEKSSKYHLSILSYVTQGDCSSNKGSSLDKVQLNDESLSDYLVAYLACLGSSFTSYVDNRPRAQLNYYAQIGGVHTRYKYARESVPVRQNIQKNTIPAIATGVRLDELRGKPRVSMDFLLGITSQNNSLDYFYEDNVYRYVGTSNYSLFSLTGNWFVNYTLLKKQKFDLYAGVGPMTRVNFFKEEFGIAETIRTTSGFTVLDEGKTFDAVPYTLGLGYKIGAVLMKNTRSRITAELIMDFTPRSVNINIANRSNLDQFNTAFMIGYSFRQLKK